MKFIGVSGFGWSGSGAVVDLLKEFEYYGALGLEFRLVKDSCGISDLESSLVTNWDVLRSNKAIDDFKWFCSVLNMKGSRFTRVGENLSNRLFIDFIKETDNYIDNLTDMKYKGNSLTFSYHLSNIYLLFKKLNRWKIDREMYFSKPTKENFLLHTRNYLETIFNPFMEKYNLNTLILDQTISVTDIEDSMKYFQDIKLIVVDRDPRDIYVDLVRMKALVGADSDASRRAERFVLWYKLIRKNIQPSKNVYFLKFEDLVLNYDIEIEKIKSFIGSENRHIREKKYFIPDVSKKNIGQWKSFQNQDEIDYIYRNLKNKCNDF